MKIIVFFVLLFFTSITHGQNENSFVMDTVAIINNVNLRSLLNSLEQENLTTKNKKRYIPKPVQKALNEWTKKFSIANPDKKYTGGCVVEYKLGIFPAPIRQLNYLGISKNFVVMTYKRGGSSGSSNVLIFKLEGDRIIDFWMGFSLNLKTKEDIISNLNYTAEIKRTYLESL